MVVGTIVNGTYRQTYLANESSEYLTTAKNFGGPKSSLCVSASV